MRLKPNIFHALSSKPETATGQAASRSIAGPEAKSIQLMPPGISDPPSDVPEGHSVKSESSKWIKREHRLGGFAWQEGYGAFTVGPGDLETVRHYISHQKEHHRVRTFQDEYVEMLLRARVDYDPKYLW